MATSTPPPQPQATPGTAGTIQPPPPTPPPPDPWADVERVLIRTVPWILILTVSLTIILLVTANFRDVGGTDAKMLTLGLSVLFAGITLVFLTRLIRSLESGETLGIESHWGGLGGGVGGWRISRPIVYLIAVVTFAALTAVAMSNFVPDEEEPKTSTATDTTKTSTETTSPTVTTSSATATGSQGTTTTAGTASDTAAATTATAAPETKGQ